MGFPSLGKPGPPKVGFPWNQGMARNNSGHPKEPWPQGCQGWNLWPTWLEPLTPKGFPRITLVGTHLPVGSQMVALEGEGPVNRAQSPFLGRNSLKKFLSFLG